MSILPYKTNVAVSFPWAGPDATGADVADRGPHGVGGYFHFSPGEIYVGGGMWHPEKPRLDAFRRLIVDDPRRVHEAIEDPAFVSHFEKISGDRLQRVPSGFPADHPDAELLKLKDVTFGRRLSDDDALSPELPDIVADDFAAAVPVMRLLASLAA